MRTIRILFILHIRGKEATIFFSSFYSSALFGFVSFPISCVCLCDVFLYCDFFLIVCVCLFFSSNLLLSCVFVCVSVFLRSNLHIGLNLIYKFYGPILLQFYKLDKCDALKSMIQ